MDEILSGVIYYLARKPEKGKPTDKPGIWAIPTLRWNSRPLVIYYSFDDDFVCLESIVVAEEE